MKWVIKGRKSICVENKHFVNTPAECFCDCRYLDDPVTLLSSKIIFKWKVNAYIFSKGCSLSHSVFVRSENKVTVHFINRDGEKITVKGSPGDSLLDVVINEDLDFDGFGMSVCTHTDTHTGFLSLILNKVRQTCVCFGAGACEGTLACSTCHLIFDEDVYKKLGPVTDEELDMLDLAYGLTDT